MTRMTQYRLTMGALLLVQTVVWFGWHQPIAVAGFLFLAYLWIKSEFAERKLQQYLRGPFNG